MNEFLELEQKEDTGHEYKKLLVALSLLLKFCNENASIITELLDNLWNFVRVLTILCSGDSGTYGLRNKCKTFLIRRIFFNFNCLFYFILLDTQMYALQ